MKIIIYKQIFQARLDEEFHKAKVQLIVEEDNVCLEAYVFAVEEFVSAKSSFKILTFLFSPDVCPLLDSGVKDLVKYLITSYHFFSE